MDGHALCPLCRHQIPTENRFCGRCGASLRSGSELATRRRESSPTVAGRALPAKLKPVGKALAVGAAVLAVEAFLSQLGRRTDRGSPPLPGLAPGTEAAVPGRLVVGWGLEEVLVVLDEGRWWGRVIERRAARWFYASETIDRPR